ncbi:MAG: hypothetical protein HC860_16140 [Alkalinema sp. RU_4_3]|nr:hypothetical protein [Alkalinema sp. RU_4_3]
MTRDRKIQGRRANQAKSPIPPRPVSGQRTVLSEEDLSPAPQPRRIPRAQLSREAFKRRLIDRTLGLVTDWRFFTLAGLGVTGSLAFFSVAFLLKLPAMPNCPSVFWPLASASLRIHCAEIAASKQNVNDLLEAIKLLNTLPPEHPLYSEASRLIEIWATDIMELAEKDYQSGKIKEAISAVRQIPEKSSAHKLVADRVKTWEKTWGDAEKIYNKAIETLKKGTWREAQVEAVRLLSIDNTFWQTTKYQEISGLIVATREDVTKLGKAERALEGGGATKWSRPSKKSAKSATRATSRKKPRNSCPNSAAECWPWPRTPSIARTTAPPSTSPVGSPAMSNSTKRWTTLEYLPRPNPRPGTAASPTLKKRSPRQGGSDPIAPSMIRPSA